MTLVIPTRNDYLDRLARDLDIPDALVEKAEQAYKDLGAWLCHESSPFAHNAPVVYPQGSFRLGTNIRPVGRGDYDIDSVCRLDLLKTSITQQDLKDRVGDHLRAHPDYAPILEEGRRCWTLAFRGFHMDVLPAIPNPERDPHGLLITDQELRAWQWSNPVGYAEWFKLQMITRFNEERSYVAKSLNVEDVPDWKVRTTLQRAVQLLKRHRDLMFKNNPDVKPISVIITTLAARAYDNNADLEQALKHIIANMTRYIEREGGHDVIRNPVDARENFADKWIDHPERRTAFYAWHARLEEDFLTVQKAVGIDGFTDQLRRSFGADLVDGVVRRYAADAMSLRDAGAMRMQTGTGLLSAGAVGPLAVERVAPSTPAKVVRPHTFFGAADGVSEG